VTDPIGVMMVHTATVQTYLGQGISADDHAAPVAVDCYAEEELHQVTSSTGQIVASNYKIFTRLPDGDKFLPKSLVAVNGYNGTVLVLIRRTAGPTPSASWSTPKST
jgi:hypothetical protein